MELPHQIELVIGDPGGDGHEKTRRYMINSTLDSTALWKAYKAGVKLLGFDFINTVATEYEERDISSDQVAKLIAAGYKIDPETDNVWRDDFVDIFLFIARLGNHEFQSEKAKSESMDIGGYGLF